MSVLGDQKARSNSKPHGKRRKGGGRAGGIKNSEDALFSTGDLYRERLRAYVYCQASSHMGRAPVGTSRQYLLCLVCKKKKRREGWEGGKSAWEKRLLVWGSNPCLFRLRQAKGESVNLGGVIEKIYFTFLGAMERKEKQPCCIFSATLWVHSRDHDRCGRALAAHVH